MNQWETKKYLQNEYIKKSRSTHDIAREHGTYPNKIKRLLQKYNIKLRNKSDAQKAALESGRHEHPTKGKNREESVKLKISSSMTKVWEDMPAKERKHRVKIAKEQWKNMSEEDKKALHRLAGEGVRKASKEGSKLEKFILDKLRANKYNVHFHRTGVVSDEKLEIDLFLPDLSVAIEIDGPAHFYPIWGEKNLEKHIQKDARKTGLLLQRKLLLIRVKQLSKAMSQSKCLQAWSEIDKVLNQKIKGPQLIEIEV